MAKEEFPRSGHSDLHLCIPPLRDTDMRTVLAV